ncbi:CoA transferase [Streptomyces wuyuanensis]|uniref:CoA transferase n=1 Tax=Streptomyces wuyuanensis TaxID=1196353 RepID=UPI00380327C8
MSDARQVLADPQLNARGHWAVLDHPEMGPSVYDNLPYRLSATPGELRGPAPLLGADTRDVCVDLLGLDPDAYERLAQEGAVG